MRACKGCGARDYKRVRVKKGGRILRRFKECRYCGSRYPIKSQAPEVYKNVRIATVLDGWDRAFGGIAEYGSVPDTRIGEMMK